jgi:hypothetical protein
MMAKSVRVLSHVAERQAGFRCIGHAAMLAEDGGSATGMEQEDAGKLDCSQRSKAQVEAFVHTLLTIKGLFDG